MRSVFLGIILDFLEMIHKIVYAMIVDGNAIASSTSTVSNSSSTLYFDDNSLYLDSDQLSHVVCRCLSGGEGDSIVFHLRFLTHSVCQCDVT